MDNQIPIKNIYYMLCYAWNVLPMSEKSMHGNDDFDDAYDLLAQVFCFGVGRLIKSGILMDYVDREEPLRTVKGRINIHRTISSLSMIDKKIICNYEEYSKDYPFNQIIKYTLISILHSSVISNSIKKTARAQLMYFSQIKVLEPTKQVRKKIFFNINNSIYRLLLSISFLLYDNLITDESLGRNEFMDFYRENQMHRVFELFILNFYRKKLPSSVYRVHAPKINWKIDLDDIDQWELAFDIDTKITDRRTDIVIENKLLKLQMIFDAKYYRNMFVNSYMNSSEEKLRVGHINQVRGYVLDSTYHGDKIGALIYPKTGDSEDVSRLLPIENSKIIVKTIDLDADWRIIEDDLLNLVRDIERNF